MVIWGKGLVDAPILVLGRHVSIGPWDRSGFTREEERLSLGKWASTQVTVYSCQGGL